MANDKVPVYKKGWFWILVVVVLAIVAAVTAGVFTNWFGLANKGDNTDDIIDNTNKESENVKILPESSELTSSDKINIKYTTGYSSVYSVSLLDSSDRVIEADLTKPLGEFGLSDKGLFKVVVYKNKIIEAQRVYIYVQSVFASSNLKTGDFTKFVSNEPVKDLPAISTSVTGQVVTQQPQLDVVKGAPMRIPFTISDLEMIAYTVKLQYRKRPVDSDDSQTWLDVADSEFVVLKTERVIVWTPTVDLTDSEVRTGTVKLGTTDVWMNEANTIQIKYPATQTAQNTTVTTALLVHSTTNQFATSVLYTNNVYKFVLVDSNSANTYTYYVEDANSVRTLIHDKDKIYVNPKYNGAKIRVIAVDQVGNVVYAVSSDTTNYWFTVGTEMFFVNTELDLDKYKTCYNVEKTMFLSIPVTVYGDPTKLSLTFSYVYAATDTESTTAVDLADVVYSWEEVYSSVSNYHDYMLHLSIEALPDNMVNYPFKIIATSSTNSSKTPYYFRNSNSLEGLAVNADNINSYNVKQIIVNDQVSKAVPLAQNLNIRWVVDGVGTSMYNIGYNIGGSTSDVVYIAKNYIGTSINWKVPTTLIDKVNSSSSKNSFSLVIAPVAPKVTSTSYLTGLMLNTYACPTSVSDPTFAKYNGTSAALPSLYSQCGWEVNKIAAASKVVDDVITYSNVNDHTLRVWTGYIKIDTANTYTFRFQVVDDVASMMIDDAIVAESTYGVNVGEGKPIYLTEGYHRFSVMLYDYSSIEWLVPQMKTTGEYADIPKTMYYYKTENLTARSIMTTQLDLKSMQYTPYYSELKPYTSEESKRQVYYNNAIKLYVSVSWFGGEFMTLPLQMLDLASIVIQYRVSGTWLNVTSLTLFNDYFECEIPSGVSKSALQIRFVYGTYFQALTEFAIDLLDNSAWYMVDSEGKLLRQDNVIKPGSVVTIENKNYYDLVKTNVNTTASYTLKLVNSEGTVVNSVKKYVPEVRSYFQLYYAFPKEIDVDKTYTLVLYEGDSTEVTRFNVYLGGVVMPFAHISVKASKEITFDNLNQRLLRPYKSGHPSTFLVFRFRPLSTLPKTAEEVVLMNYGGITLCTHFINGRRNYYTLYRSGTNSLVYQQPGAFYSVADGETDAFVYVLSVARTGTDKMSVSNWFHHGSWNGWESSSYGTLSGPYLSAEVPIRPSIVDYEKDFNIKFFPHAVFDSVLLYEFTNEYTLNATGDVVFNDKANQNIDELASLFAFGSRTMFEIEDTFSITSGAQNKYGWQKLAYFNFNNVASGYAKNEFTGVTYDISDVANVNLGLIDDPSVTVDGNRAYFMLISAGNITYYVNDTKVGGGGGLVLNRQVFDDVKSGDKIKFVVDHKTNNAWFIAKYYWNGRTYYSKAGDTLYDATTEEKLNAIEVFSSRVNSATLLPDLGSFRHSMDYTVSPYAQVLWTVEGNVEAGTVSAQKLRFEYVLA